MTTRVYISILQKRINNQRTELENLHQVLEKKDAWLSTLDKRLRHLLQSETVRSYDEVDYQTKEYVKDIASLDANIKNHEDWLDALKQDVENLQKALREKDADLERLLKENYRLRHIHECPECKHFVSCEPSTLGICAGFEKEDTE